LYRASQHGFDAVSFHKYCDNKGPTIVIIKNEIDYIFGGFTNVSWTSPQSGTLAEDENAFLFNIHPFNKKYKLKPSNKQCAVCHNSKYGPTFGSGHDLYICSNCDHIKSSCAYSKYTYDIPPNELSGTQSPACFIVKNYEVYLIQ